MKNWYDKYIGFPYLHLGLDPKTGIDCFNLIKYIYLQEKNIDIPYSTKNFCANPSEGWYYSDNRNIMLKVAKGKFGWHKVSSLEPFDIILLSLGATNCINHCMLYVGDNKVLHTYIDSISRISTFGKYYKQYANDNYFRWNGIINDNL